MVDVSNRGVDSGARSAVLDLLREAGTHPLVTSFPHGAVFFFDTDLRYLAAGGLGLTDVGLSREGLEGRTIVEVFPADTAAAIEPLYRAALRGESSEMDVQYEDRVYLQRLAPVHDEVGEIVAGIGFTQDVSAARAAEHKLRESNQRIRLMFENAPIGQALVELDGRWREVNTAVCTLTGYDAEQLKSMTFQDITHPDDLETDLEHLGRLIEGQISSYEIEKRYFTATGQTVWVLLAVSLVRDERGAPDYFIAQIQDITERKRQQDALQDLVAMLAHDLRTPATVIDGFAAILADLDRGADPSETQDYLGRIRAASRSMHALLDNAMTATRFAAGLLTPSPEHIELSSFTTDLARSLEGQIPSVLADIPTGLTAWVDRGHLSQILTNLLVNAKKYGGDTVRVSAAPGAGSVNLAVVDNGSGVEAEFIPDLFERFTRSATARTSSTRGSGLGLYIVRDLARANGGDASYDPSGDGARFDITLPVAPEQP